MNETNLDWRDLQLFLTVARERGLAPASRITGRSPATLGRRMSHLERVLGQELFIRHDRGYELTRTAQDLLAQLDEVEAQITKISAPAQTGSRPLVKVSAGTWTTLILLDHMAALTGSPPDIRLRFIAAEEVLDIAHREVVIGFRNKRPTKDTLAGRKLARVEFAAYATPDAPQLWIKVIADTPSARWLDRTVGPDALCEVNAPRNSLDLALQGHGMALLPTFLGDRKPGLERRGAPIPELAHDQWIVTHHDDRHLPEVRRAIDRMCAVLRQAT